MAASGTSSTSVGTLSTSTGVARLIGTSSKIDTDSLVTAAYEAKRAPAVRLESSIKSNEAKSAAYGDLKSLLTSLKNAVAGLRNPLGALSATDNLFEAKEAYLTSSSTTAATSLVGVDVTPGTAKGSFTMSVGRLATVEKQASLGVGAGFELLRPARASRSPSSSRAASRPAARPTTKPGWPDCRRRRAACPVTSA